MSVRRAIARWTVAAMTLGLAAPPRGLRAGDETEQGIACAVPAFVDDDATSLAAYDGLRRGLEEAHLPRVCRHRVDGDATAWSRKAGEIAAQGAAWVFALGASSSLKVAATSWPTRDGTGRIPCVYVDGVATSAGVPFLPPPERAPPAAIVRAETPIEVTVPLLRRAFGADRRPTLRLAWRGDSPSARPWRDAVEAAGISTRVEGEDAGSAVDAVLDAPIGLGETALAPDAALALAKSLRVPLFSLDRGRFGHGAAVVVGPDAALLGRVAAEAARRVLAGEGQDRPLRLAVRAVELWIDLDAADAQGFHVPLPFVAAADRVRSTRAPATGEGRR